MIIYGVALLSLCTLAGLAIGQLLGYMFGIPSNVGGVGIAMVILIVASDYLQKHKKIDVKTEQGVAFWSAIYIPIVVAMAAKQNVIGAITGGPMAITAGVTAVAVGFALVPVITKMGTSSVSQLDKQQA